MICTEILHVVKALLIESNMKINWYFELNMSLRQSILQ